MRVKALLSRVSDPVSNPGEEVEINDLTDLRQIQYRDSNLYPLVIDFSLTPVSVQVWDGHIE